MTVVVSKPRYTPDDLLMLPDMEGFELVDGELVEKNMGAESSWIAGRLHTRLSNFNEEAFLGWTFPSDTSYQCFSEDPNRVRKPDVSFVALGRLPDERIPTGHIQVVPDMVAEVVSPNDLYSEVRGKIAEYQRAGVRLIWIIDPNTRTVEVRRHGQLSVETLTENNDLTGDDLLPGFRCTVANLFPPAPAAPPPPHEPVDSQS